MSVRLAGGLATREAALPDCPVDRAMRAFGNRTAMLLLREAFYGATRFDDFAVRVGVTDAVASQRLRELVEVGIFSKQPYREAGQRTRYEYVLTPAGHELMPVVFALGNWGSRHLPGSAPSLTHDGCGEPVVVTARCRAGHDVPEEELLVTGRTP